MLWFDNRKAPLGRKIAEAAIYYAGKYGRPATMAVVNPADLEPVSPDEPCALRILSDKIILPNHILIGNPLDAGKGPGGADRKAPDHDEETW